MKSIRLFVFWAHLAVGVSAGLVIAVMSATGTLLAFKPQILDIVERDARFVAQTDASAPRLSPSQLVEAARAAQPHLPATALTVERDPRRSAVVGFGRDQNLYLNPYSGAALGPGSVRAQGLFRTFEDWHRWLGVSAENRGPARAITAAANLAFLGLALSGVVLWWPWKSAGRGGRAMFTFKRGLAGRARDFNWHNVVGWWCASVLIVLTASGVVMAYPWANDLVYRVTHSPLPKPAPRPAREAAMLSPGNHDGHLPASASIDELWRVAEEHLPTWRTMALRFPPRGSRIDATMTDTRSWNAFARSQIAFDARTGEVIEWQPYEQSSLGQKVRGWLRYAHTGELGGWPAQFLAGLASLGGVVLVATGLALACRRLWAYVRPRQADAPIRAAARPRSPRRSAARPETTG